MPLKEQDPLTPSQQLLIDLLATTPIRAKVGALTREADGKRGVRYYTRDCFPIAFPERRGEFAFFHHRENPYAPRQLMYFNLRNLPERLYFLMAKEICLSLPGERPDLVTGIPNAGIPIAQHVAELLRVEYRDLIIKNETHPKILIPNPTSPISHGETVLLIDDVLAKGFSKMAAIDSIETQSYKIFGLGFLVERGQGGREHLSKRQPPVRTYYPFDIYSVLNYLSENRGLSRQRKSAIIRRLDMT